MSEVVNIYEELKGHIREALLGMSGVSVDANGLYYSECYKDYRDVLEDSDIADILAGQHKYMVNGEKKVEHMPPRDVFYTLIAEYYEEAVWDVENTVLGNLKENEAVMRFVKEHEIDEDVLRDCLMDVWYATPPYDDFLKQEVCMDIMLDTGDCNYEFTCNNLASTDIECVEDFDDNSSLLWLCEQQGITREELLAAFDKGTAFSNEVVELRARKNEIVETLKEYGFDVPQFNRGVHHTGAYREYTNLQEHQDALQAKIMLFKTKYEDNNISYQDYLKKHFDRFERVDPLSEEQFDVKKTEFLGNIIAKLETANAEFARVKEQLDFHKDYRQIAILQGECKDIERLLAGLAKTEAYQKAEFINSVHNEISNTYGSCVVTFLVKMSLDEAINLKEVVLGEKELNNSYYYEERKGMSSITLDKGACCGLMDDCSGKGSVFEIKLLKDVEIPVKALYRAVPDKGNGNYGFMEIYGADDGCFKESLKGVHEVKSPLVNELISDAVQTCEEVNKDVLGKNEVEFDKE